MHAVQFPPGDRANPRLWSKSKKWCNVLVLTTVNFPASWAASGFSAAASSWEQEFGVDEGTLPFNLSLYLLGLALGSIVFAPLSESLGRRPVYIAGFGLSLLFLLVSALAESVEGFFLVRLLSGFFLSVGTANIGGTIADLWPHDESGPAMSVYVWASLCGWPSGFLVFGPIAQSRGFRGVFWALLGICGVCWLLMVGLTSETRHATILRRRAHDQLAFTGTQRIYPRSLVRRRVLSQKRWADLFRTALSRPLRFLSGEATIILGATVNAILYVLGFLFLTLFAAWLGDSSRDKFDSIQIGLGHLGLIVGITLGPITNLAQEHYYQRRILHVQGAHAPEARVQLAMVAIFLQPLSLYWFACSADKVHWMVPIAASTVWGWSFYTLVLMSYMYTEDAYGVYAASALASNSLVHNLACSVTPLVVRFIIEDEGFNRGAVILALCSLSLLPLPFALVQLGPWLRCYSPWTDQHLQGNEDGEEDQEEDEDDAEDRAADLEVESKHREHLLPTVRHRSWATRSPRNPPYVVTTEPSPPLK